MSLYDPWERLARVYMQEPWKPSAFPSSSTDSLMVSSLFKSKDFFFTVGKLPIEDNAKLSQKYNFVDHLLSSFAEESQTKKLTIKPNTKQNKPGWEGRKGKTIWEIPFYVSKKGKGEYLRWRKADLGGRSRQKRENAALYITETEIIYTRMQIRYCEAEPSTEWASTPTHKIFKTQLQT